MTFESNRSRNMFLKDKSKHKVGSKLVDVKPYIYNPDKVNKVYVSPISISHLNYLFNPVMNKSKLRIKRNTPPVLYTVDF